MSKKNNWAVDKSGVAPKEVTKHARETSLDAKPHVVKANNGDRFSITPPKNTMFESFFGTGPIKIDKV